MSLMLMAYGSQGVRAAASTAVAYTALPIATAALSVPDYSNITTLRGLNATTPWEDPWTGLDVYRLTTDAEGTSYLAYGNGGPWVSLPDADGVYWVASAGLVASSVTRLHMIGFKPGVGRVGSPVDTGLSDNVNGDIGCGWSHVESGVFYRCNGRILRKYTWDGESLTEVESGVWPKDLSAFGTVSRYTWMTHDASDRVFTVTDNTESRIVVWDSVADTVTQLDTADFSSAIPSGYTLDEGYVSHDGRYVMVKLSPLGFLIYDRTTEHFSECVGHTSHPSIGRAKAWMPYGYAVVNPLIDLDTGGNVVGEGRYEWVAQSVTADAADVSSTFRKTHTSATFGNTRKVEMTRSHSSISHVQSGEVDAQWWLHGGVNPSDLAWDNAWSLDTGAIYQRTWASSTRPPVAVAYGSNVASVVDGGLTEAASRAAMVAGTFFADPATRILYAWLPDSGTVSTTTVIAVWSAPVQLGVYAVDPIGDGTEDEYRAIAFAYPHPREDVTMTRHHPFPSSSPDGRVVVFNSTFGREGGQLAICALAMPTGGA
jgi:hypothetical protein